VAPASPLLTLDGMPGELERVEAALRSSVIADDPYLTEIASHLIQAGGKRLRPALAIVSAGCRIGIPVSDGVILGGVAVELVQVGSLYHDDVIDEALTRRGVESVNARWGNLRAILSGDVLLAKASEIAASLGVEVAGLLAATIGSLCEGQVRELQTTYSSERTEEQYLSSIAGKTASLFAAAVRIGAIVGELERNEIESLTLFGHRYGMAFQIVDDVLDVVATDEQLGKPSGQDLAEGVYTLPVIRALRRNDAVAGELRSMLGSPLERGDVDRARKLVRADGAIEDALVLARSYCDAAIDALAPLADSGAPVEALAAAAAALTDSVPEL
jgi:heptaprenyl diphosphate synthase